MKEFFNAVIRANLEIAGLIDSVSVEHLCEGISLGAGGDISSRIDLSAEKIFIKYLSGFGNINSEECGFIDMGKENDIIIDPIDGSSNFASNFPYYGTSVALKKDDKCLAAVVVNLASAEIFVKEDKSFRRANLRSMNFRDVVKNKNSQFGLFERAYCSKITPELMRKHGIKYRSPGAFALSLAYARDVDFVLYEGQMREYDIAAGLYMCEDLHVEKREDLLLVSQNKETFDRILHFI